MKRILLSFGLVFSLVGGILAQDIHFSQFFNSPLNTNPALTGVFDGDLRFGLHFKQQWQSVPVNYLTFSGSADKKFYSKKIENGFFGGGLHINYDRSGDSRLSLAQGALSGSYTHKLNTNNYITLGVQAGVNNLAADFGSEHVSWGSQWTGLQYNQALSSNEPFASREAITYFDLGGGLNYRWQRSKRTKINLGVGAYNFLAPEQSFNDNASIPSELPIRLSVNLNTSFQLSQLLDLQVHGLAAFQDEYQEFVPSLVARLHLNNKKGREFALDIGGIGRLNENEVDAWTPYFGIEFNQWYVGLNYDINASEFDIATDRKGGPEIFLRHIITKVKPLEAFKNCPIY